MYWRDLKTLARNLPNKWKIGMRIRCINSREKGLDYGEEGIIGYLDANCEGKTAEETQSLFVYTDKRGLRAVISDDVELVL